MFPIIDDASGVIKPGVFTILLGPPGSGKTTFLQTLAGRNRRGSKLKARRGCGAAAAQEGTAAPAGLGTAAAGPDVTHIAQPCLACLPARLPGLQVKAAELTYNGHRFDEFVVERSAAYVSQVCGIEAQGTHVHAACSDSWGFACAPLLIWGQQVAALFTHQRHNVPPTHARPSLAYATLFPCQVDNHYGELTVRETFEFSARCQSTGYKRGGFHLFYLVEPLPGLPVPACVGLPARLMLPSDQSACRACCACCACPFAALLEEVVARELEMGVTPDPEVRVQAAASLAVMPSQRLYINCCWFTLLQHLPACSCTECCFLALLIMLFGCRRWSLCRLMPSCVPPP
jgi:energy-coupling factor transporter ATP-binding protein EcfA2